MISSPLRMVDSKLSSRSVHVEIGLTTTYFHNEYSCIPIFNKQVSFTNSIRFRVNFLAKNSKCTVGFWLSKYSCATEPIPPVPAAQSYNVCVKPVFVKMLASSLSYFDPAYRFGGQNRSDS